MMLNEELDACYSSMPSGMSDGQARGSSGSDRVSGLVTRIERIKSERDAEQERINAVDWAKNEVRDSFSDIQAPTVINALGLYLRRQTEAALLLLDSAEISRNSFFRAKNLFLRQILSYLHMKDY